MSDEQLRTLADLIQNTAINGQSANLALMSAMVIVVCFTFVTFLLFRLLIRHAIPLMRQFLDTFKTLTSNVKSLAYSETEQLAILQKLSVNQDALASNIIEVKQRISELPDETRRKIEPMFADFLRDVADEMSRSSAPAPAAPRPTPKKTGVRAVLAALLLGEPLI